ncbi:beta carbonic anhydrase 1 [Octopus bimaculoides]|uniref:Carbonic anhydrase n=1 Tax=Octopus bimaculoides TaxID=37653 RepID=A0A0L8IE68_OCTBM|nr:beta carbonic anhydrase 1 [Octopus bimaculoides]|eukprot:XP_014776038.1 PREDICTED: beta carbonic anhydrase 1-like [Octopus bimaculoides]
MKGLEKILRGIIKYQITDKVRVKLNPQNIIEYPTPNFLFISCIDNRVLPSQFTKIDCGDAYIVRNAGNLFPPRDAITFNTVTAEAGAIEVACHLNNVRHIFVCGHSDCKAMNLLFSLKNQCHTHAGTPLQMWLKKYGVASVRKFDQLDSKFVGPLTFQGRFSQLNFQVNIDPENKFPIEDKLSQVNCLQQLQHIATFPILHDKLSKNQIRLHAIWIDVRTGNVFIFSRDEKQFVEITDRNYLQLVRECFPVD